MKENKLTKQRPGQQQTAPGLQKKMKPRPVVKKREYIGSAKLSGKIALITGGDSGIGRSIAVHYAKEGADVAILYLKEHRDAKETQRLVEITGKKCLLIPGDAGDENFCKQAVKKVISTYGKLDVLVNNAAEQHPQKSIEDITEKQLEKRLEQIFFPISF